MGNYKKINFPARLLKKIFDNGVFDDPRPLIYSRKAFKAKLIPCNYLSGGVSSWKRIIFEKVAFDVGNDMHYFEDIDFSLRVAMSYEEGLFINTLAKVIDKPSLLSRDSVEKAIYRKTIEGYKLYLKFGKGNAFALYSFLLKYLIYSAYETIISKKFDSLRLYFSAISLIVSKRINLAKI